jgi:DNA-binding HxlR family transcriptional regulator
MTAPRRVEEGRGPGDAAPRGAPQDHDAAPCCPHYHQAVELLGQRWNGAIVEVLLRAPVPLRFTDVAAGVPDISDRLLTQRLRQLAHRGVIARTGPRSQPRYALTPMGRDLEPAITALTAWGRRWLDTSASSFRQA